MKLEIGYNHPFEIRREKCFANCEDAFSVLFLSDLHLNKFSGGMIPKIISAINDLDPTIILFGGDYVDSEKGLDHLDKLLKNISQRKNSFAIAGNHDYGSRLEQIKNSMISNNVAWIEKKSTRLKIKNTTLTIDGNLPLKKENSLDFSILLLHKPIDINRFHNDYNLALAGHLHGCQFVFRQSGDKLFPGKFFYKWNILKAKLNTCYYFIGKGLGDTLPLRYNCKKELLFIEVTPNN